MRSFESMQVNSQKEQCYIPINSIKSRKSIASTLKGEILFHVHVPTSSFEKIKTIDGVQRSPNLYFNPHRFLMCRRMGKKMEKLFCHWWFVLSWNVWNSERERNTGWDMGAYAFSNLSLLVHSIHTGSITMTEWMAGLLLTSSLDIPWGISIHPTLVVLATCRKFFIVQNTEEKNNMIFPCLEIVIIKFLLRRNCHPLPSQSMQFSSISPAPSSSTAFASSKAPIGRPSRPPFTYWENRQIWLKLINK